MYTDPCAYTRQVGVLPLSLSPSLFRSRRPACSRIIHNYNNLRTPDSNNVKPYTAEVNQETTRAVATDSDTLCPISLITLSLLRLLDSNFPENPLWAWEFHPLNLQFCYYYFSTIVGRTL